jgi:hypothetical protein
MNSKVDRPRSVKQPADYRREHCQRCEAVLLVKVCESRAGYYIGTDCENCGPHGRFSGYTPHKDVAERVLKAFLENPCRLRYTYLCDGEVSSVHWLCCEEPWGELSVHYYTTLASIFPRVPA